VLWLSSPAGATILSGTSLCPSANGQNDGSEFSKCVFPDADTLVVDTPNPDGGTQHFVGHASASATQDQWKTAVDVTVSDYRRDQYIWSPNANNPNSFHVPAAAGANATSTDQITITGGAGVYSLNFIFGIDGTLSSTDPNLFLAQVCAFLLLPEGVGTVTAYCQSGNRGPLDTGFTLTYADLPFAGPVDPTISINSSGLIEPIFAADVPTIGADVISGSLAASFGSTITLKYLLVTDADGTPIPNVSISSASGFAYPLAPANINAVPGPSTLLMVASGMALAGLVARRKLARWQNPDKVPQQSGGNDRRFSRTYPRATRLR
jgi:hypothetical protein